MICYICGGVIDVRYPEVCERSRQQRVLVSQDLEDIAATHPILGRVNKSTYSYWYLYDVYFPGLEEYEKHLELFNRALSLQSHSSLTDDLLSLASQENVLRYVQMAGVPLVSISHYIQFYAPGIKVRIRTGLKKHYSLKIQLFVLVVVKRPYYIDDDDDDGEHENSVNSDKDKRSYGTKMLEVYLLPILIV